MRDGVPIELRKQLSAGLAIRHDRRIGGFLPLRPRGRAASRGDWWRITSARGRAHLPHEEAVRDLLRERSQVFDVADVTGAPWIEIDFPADVARAAHEVLPQLQPLSRGTQ